MSDAFAAWSQVSPMSCNEAPTYDGIASPLYVFKPWCAVVAVGKLGGSDRPPPTESSAHNVRERV